MVEKRTFEITNQLGIHARVAAKLVDTANRFDAEIALAKDGVENETRTINVGGGGIRFVAKDKLNVNEKWNFSLLLPGEKVIKGTGKILYTLLQGQSTAGVIAFIDINETERNRLIKLCFDEEIRNMKQRRL